MAVKEEAVVVRRRRFALFGSSKKTVRGQCVKDILAILQRYAAEVMIESSYADRLVEAGIDVSDIPVFSGLAFTADYAITIGGDGTFLHTATRIHSLGIPLMGVNTGRLGFLAEVLPREFATAIEAIYSDCYTLERHSLLSVTVTTDRGPLSWLALNEVAVLKRDTASMINVEVHIDQDAMAVYRADGLIIATPTGSTAYNLSNGGPIMAPSAQTLCLTAVAPHSLTFRPIVVADSAVFTLSVTSRSKSFLLAIDGRSETLAQGVTITVRKAPCAVTMVKLPHKNYFDTLREKMMWGADARL